VYRSSLKSQILRLIDVVAYHRWFWKRKQTLRQWTGWCVVFGGNVRTRWKRSIRHLFQWGDLKLSYATI